MDEGFQLGEVVVLPWGVSEVRGTVAEVYGDGARQRAVISLTPAINGYGVDEPTTVTLPIERIRRQVLGATHAGDGGGGNDLPVAVTLPADVQQIDQTGYVWTLLDGAADPSPVVDGALIVAGDSEEPLLARVLDIIDGPNDRRIVHLDVVGVPDQAIEALRHAHLLPQ